MTAAALTTRMAVTLLALVRRHALRNHLALFFFLLCTIAVLLS